MGDLILGVTPCATGSCREQGEFFDVPAGVTVHRLCNIVIWVATHNSQSPVYVLQFHGLAGTLDSRRCMFEIAARYGVNLIAFDYPGYGASAGCADATTMWNASCRVFCWAAANVSSSENLVFWGESFGSCFAAMIAAKRKIRGVVFYSGIYDITAIIENLRSQAVRGSTEFEVLRLLAAILHRDETITQNINPAHYIGLVTAPVIVAHSVDDRLSPFSQALEIYRAARGKKFLIQGTGTHQAVMFARSQFQEILLFLGARRTNENSPARRNFYTC